MSIARGVSLRACASYAFRIVFAFLIVTVVFGTSLPLKCHYAFANRWESLASGWWNGTTLWRGLINCGGSENYMRHLYAEFREPVRVFGENIFIHDRTPEKEMGFCLPCVHKVLFGNACKRSVDAFWPNRRQCVVSVFGKVVVHRQTRTPRLNIGLNDNTAGRGIPAIDPVQREFLPNPRLEVWPCEIDPQSQLTKVEECSLAGPGGFISALGYIPQEKSEDRENASKNSSPHSSFILEENIEPFSSCLFRGFVCHGLESSKPR